MAGIAHTFTESFDAMRLGIPADFQHVAPSVSQRVLQARDGPVCEWIISVPNFKSDAEVNRMRVFWERIGIILPVYRLLGQWLSDGDIATKLKLPQLSVEGCVGWLLQFLRLKDRSELVQYAETGSSI
jgi:hypothetical protein